MRAKIAKYLTMLGMLFNVAWFLWNPDGWIFEWEPIVVFTLTLAGFIAADVYDKPLHGSANLNSNDAALFKKFQDALPVNGVMRFIKSHDFLGSFNKEDISPMGRFAYEWDNPEHEFIHPTLEELRKEFLTTVNAFNIAVATYTSPNNSGFQAVRVDSQKHDPEHDARFRDEAKIINEAATKTYAAYESLVREARKILSLA